MRKSDWSSIITGIAIGIGIGAALGILFAPQSGEDTREYLGRQRRINDTKDRFSDVNERPRLRTLQQRGRVRKGFARQAQDSVEEVKGHLQDIADAGQRAYRDAAKA